MSSFFGCIGVSFLPTQIQLVILIMLLLIIFMYSYNCYETYPKILDNTHLDDYTGAPTSEIFTLVRAPYINALGFS